MASFLFLMAYGFTLGLTKSPLQAVSSSIKMPILFLSTMAFSLPALYFFSLALLGTPFRMVQVLTIVLAGISVTAFLLLGLAPITLFFVMTSSNYAFSQLLAVVFVGISALIGIYFLWRGLTLIETTREGTFKSVGKYILGLWMVLFGFVGTQLTWRLSPFIGRPEDRFYIIKPSRDNFYVDVVNAIQQAFHLPGLDVNLDTPLIMAGLCVVGLLAVLLIAGISPSVSERDKAKIPFRVTLADPELEQAVPLLNQRERIPDQGCKEEHESPEPVVYERHVPEKEENHEGKHAPDLRHVRPEAHRQIRLNGTEAIEGRERDEVQDESRDLQEAQEGQTGPYAPGIRRGKAKDSPEDNRQQQIGSRTGK